MRGPGSEGARRFPLGREILAPRWTWGGNWEEAAMSVSVDAAISNRRVGGEARTSPKGSTGRSAPTSARSSTEPQQNSRVNRLLVSLAILVAGAVMVAPFGGLVQAFDYHAMVVALRRTPAIAIAWSIGATALSFAALVGRDASALRYIGARTSFPVLLLASFCGTALGNAAGLGALTGAAVRYRIYGAVGIKSDDIARLLAVRRRRLRSWPGGDGRACRPRRGAADRRSARDGLPKS